MRNLESNCGDLHSRNDRVVSIKIQIANIRRSMCCLVCECVSECAVYSCDGTDSRDWRGATTSIHYRVSNTTERCECCRFDWRSNGEQLSVYFFVIFLQMHGTHTSIGEMDLYEFYCDDDPHRQGRHTCGRANLFVRKSFFQCCLIEGLRRHNKTVRCKQLSMNHWALHCPHPARSQLKPTKNPMNKTIFYFLRCWSRGGVECRGDGSRQKFKINLISSESNDAHASPVECALEWIEAVSHDFIDDSVVAVAFVLQTLRIIELMSYEWFWVFAFPSQCTASALKSKIFSANYPHSDRARDSLLIQIRLSLAVTRTRALFLFSA